MVRLQALLSLIAYKTRLLRVRRSLTESELYSQVLRKRLASRNLRLSSYSIPPASSFLQAFSQTSKIIVNKFLLAYGMLD